MLGCWTSEQLWIGYRGISELLVSLTVEQSKVGTFSEINCCRRRPFKSHDRTYTNW